MNNVSPVFTVEAKCQDCYRCIRRCPVKAIRVEHGHAKVMGELCIACGRCVMHCPSHAKKYRDDTQDVLNLLRAKKQVFLSLAPSFRAEFPECSSKDLIDMLKRLGFYAVSETALGADLVSEHLSHEFVGERKLYISSACPAVVGYVKHYMADYAKYVTDCTSPLLAHARFLRKLYGQDIGVVFAGPCIAKKLEADSFSEIDVAITFKELRKLFYAAAILPPETNQARMQEDLGEAFVPCRAAKAELYPIDGGMIAAIKRYNPLKNVRTISVCGIEALADTLRGLNVEELREPLFIEALSCVGGCVNGPGTEQDSAMALRRMQTIDYAILAKDKIGSDIIEKKPLMNGTIAVAPVEQQQFTEQQIKEAMRTVGKYSAADEINCNGCGYETCRHFAEALLRGVAEKTMCVSHMRQLAQKKANGLVQAIPSGVVIVNKDMTIVDCNRNFAKLMGQDVLDMYEVKPGLEGADLETMTQSTSIFRSVLVPNGPEVVEKEVREKKKILHYSIFVIEKEQVAAGVVEDVTAPKNQKERTITKAQEVIDKNLATVQKIAFLLGENAAETESMLNSIIESYSLEDEDAKDAKNDS